MEKDTFLSGPIAVSFRNSQQEVDLKQLDKSQYAAVTSGHSNVLISAPAGSGKTKSLITAIASYRYNNAVDRICAITYTRAARAEMSERLNALGVYDVEVSTIHSWSRSMLLAFSKMYNFTVTILQESQIRAVLKEIVTEYLRTSKFKSVNIDILYTFIMGGKNMDVTDNYKRLLNALDSRYQEYKAENHLYDCNDYPKYLYDVLLTYDEYITTIDALFVDEFQDVDLVQLEIFKRVKSSKKFYIGDQKQSIYVFRGADGKAFERLTGFTEFQLQYNYRSYQEIIDWSAYVYSGIKNLKNQGAKGPSISDLISSEGFLLPNKSYITCTRGYGGTVSVVTSDGVGYKFTKPKNEEKDTFLSVTGINNVEQSLIDMLAKQPRILCRSNKQVKALEGTMYTATTVHQAKGLEYDNVIVIDVPIKNEEDLNIAYVALTRAKNNVFIIDWAQFESIVLRSKGGGQKGNELYKYNRLF